jgi:hypothetical protein
MPTKRNRRVGVQSRKVKKPKNFSRKLSVSGKANKRGSSAHGSSTHRSGTHGSSTHGSSTHGSSTHGSGTRRRVQRGGDLFLGIPLPLWVFGGLAATTVGYAVVKEKFGKKREAPSSTGDVGQDV